MKFIESIRLEHGRLFNLALHQRRLDLTTLAHFGAGVRINLDLELAHRSLPASGLYKIRVTYARQIIAIDIDPYTRHAVERIELVEAGGLDYRYKYADRAGLDAVRAQVPAGVQPILLQGGLVSDALYANVCFYNGSRWLTPDKPLLAGTARAAALSAGEIEGAAIAAADVGAGKYPKLKFINCMNLFAEAPEVLLN